MFCKKGALRNFVKCTGKHLCQSLFFNNTAGPCNFIKKEVLAHVFSCEFCEISKNTCSYWAPLVAASDLKTSYSFGKGICISRPPAFCLAPDPGSGPRPPALNPNLYLTALAPNMCLPALAPNLCLATLGPNLYLQALPSNLLFTSSGQDFTTTTAATCTITTTTITTTTTTTTTSTTRDINKRCLHGSKIHIKWSLKDIWWKSQVLFQ